MYTPETGMNLDMLKRDVRFMKARYTLDVPGRSEGRLVIRLVEEQRLQMQEPLIDFL